MTDDAADASIGALRRILPIANKRGLHARAAAWLGRVAEGPAEPRQAVLRWARRVSVGAIVLGLGTLFLRKPVEVVWQAAGAAIAVLALAALIR